MPSALIDVTKSRYTVNPKFSRLIASSIVENNFVKKTIKMSQYLLAISDNNAASSFLEFIKKLDFVQKVEQVKEPIEPLSKEDWIKPGRPATDEEFKRMITEVEEEEKTGLGMVAEKAEEYATKRIEEWQKKSK